MVAEVTGVGVDVGHHISAENLQRPPHGVALAEHRARLAYAGRHWRCTSAPRARAISAVASEESSTTTTWSTAPAAASSISESSIGPIVAASLRAGTQTETLTSRSASIRSRGNSEWWCSDIGAE